MQGWSGSQVCHMVPGFCFSHLDTRVCGAVLQRLLPCPAQPPQRWFLPLHAHQLCTAVLSSHFPHGKVNPQRLPSLERPESLMKNTWTAKNILPGPGVCQKGHLQGPQLALQSASPARPPGLCGPCVGLCGTWWDPPALASLLQHDERGCDQEGILSRGCLCLGRG